MPDTLIGTTDSAAATAQTTAPATDTTTQASPSSAPRGYVGDDGSFADGWLDRLPGELDPAKQTLAKYRGLPELAKSHFELQQLLGKKSSAVNIPGEKSTPEEIAAYRKAVGVPETVDGYQLKPEKLPDGVTWDDATGKAFAEIAHKHHIPAAAMKELAALQLSQESMRAEEVGKMIGAELERGKQELQTAWGANFDKNISLAARVAQTVGLDPHTDGLRDPKVVQALVRFAGMMSEDKLVTGEFAPSMQAGKIRAKAIMTDKSNPLYAKYQEGDGETVELVRSLMRHG